CIGITVISQVKINFFFTQAQALHDWHLGEVTVEPFAEKTPAAAALLASLREKIEDYFSRVKVVAFDPRAAATINGEEEELVRLSALSLADTEVLACLPLAKIGETLTL